MLKKLRKSILYGILKRLHSVRRWCGSDGTLQPGKTKQTTTQHSYLDSELQIMTYDLLPPFQGLWSEMAQNTVR
jgi:hypothetical protein